MSSHGLMPMTILQTLALAAARLEAAQLEAAQLDSDIPGVLQGNAHSLLMSKTVLVEMSAPLSGKDCGALRLLPL